MYWHKYQLFKYYTGLKFLLAPFDILCDMNTNTVGARYKEYHYSMFNLTNNILKNKIRWIELKLDVIQFKIRKVFSNLIVTNDFHEF